MKSEPNASLPPGTERRMLEAVLDGDADSWTRLSQSLSGERAFDVMSVATEAAVFRKWPLDPSLEEIADYVTVIRSRFPKELPVGGTAIEAVIRGALGEPELVRGTPGKDILLAELLIVKSIYQDVLLDSADRESYLAEILAAVK